MKLRYLVLLGVLAFLGALLFQAPAALLYAASHPEKSSGNVRLYGVNGTLADGGFAALTVGNRPVLNEARWHLHPAWLALLRLSADLDAGGELPLHLHVSRAVFGTLRLSDIKAEGSAKALLGLFGQPNLPVEGQATVDLPLVRLDHSIPVEARGTAEVRNFTWTAAKDPMPLGSFTATASTDDKGMLITLESGPGPVELQGSITVSRDHAYEVRVQLRPRPDASPTLKSYLQSLGPVDAQGWYPIRRSGTLAPPAPATPAG